MEKTAEEYIYKETGYEITEDNRDYDCELSWAITTFVMNKYAIAYSNQQLAEFKNKLKDRLTEEYKSTGGEPNKKLFDLIDNL